MELKDKIKKLADTYFDELVAVRRHLHENPELSFEEVETAKFISKKLSEYNIEHHNNIGGHGIVGFIKGKNPEKKTIALRADMDALPIEEKNDVSYKSK